MEKGGRPSISEANWKRVSRTLDFILSYPPAEKVESKPVQKLKPVQTEYRQPTFFPREGVVFEAGKQGV